MTDEKTTWEDEIAYDIEQLKVAKGDVVLINIKSPISQQQFRKFRRHLYAITEQLDALVLATNLESGIDISVHSPHPNFTELEDRIRRLEEVGAHVWEVDIRKDNSQWGEQNCNRVKVTLDGVDQPLCRAADSVRGMVLRFKAGSDGKPRRSGHRVLEEIVCGKVVITEEPK